MWELGIALHLNESKAAVSIKEAKAACSQVTLNAHVTCSQLALEVKTNCSEAILEAKTTCSMAVKKAKTTRGHMVQEAEATCSKAISEVEAQRVLQAESLKGSMAASCRTWRNKSLERRAEVELTSSLFVRLSCTTAHWSLKVPWLLPTTSYWGKHLHCLHFPCHRGLPLVEEQPIPATLPTPAPKQSPRPKRQHFTTSCGEHAYGWNHPKG